MITDKDITKLKQAFATKEDLNAIRNLITQSLKPVNKKLNKLQKDLNIVINTFDKNIIETKHRVDRIEKHLDLPPIHN